MRRPFLTPGSADGMSIPDELARREAPWNRQALEKIANTGHFGRRRRRHPANVGYAETGR